MFLELVAPTPVLQTVNGTSLRAGEYEDFKKASIDPYVALREAYYQYRRHLGNNVEGKAARSASLQPAE